jgi:hypothetical protein
VVADSHSLDTHVGKTCKPEVWRCRSLTIAALPRSGIYGGSARLSSGKKHTLRNVDPASESIESIESMVGFGSEATTASSITASLQLENAAFSCTLQLKPPSNPAMIGNRTNSVVLYVSLLLKAAMLARNSLLAQTLSRKLPCCQNGGTPREFDAKRQFVSRYPPEACPCLSSRPSR